MSADNPLIMVVDDNPDFLDGVELTLEMEGFTVWTAENGEAALDKLHQAFRGANGGEVGLQQLPDLILADIMMPVMDGYEFYDEVRENPYLNHIPFVFLTAKTDDSDVRAGKGLGADDYLRKPCSTEDLLATIRGKLRRVQKQRELSAQFTGALDRAGGPNLAVAIILGGGLLGVGFCAGMAVSWWLW